LPLKKLIEFKAKIPLSKSGPMETSAIKKIITIKELLKRRNKSLLKSIFSFL
jgi:hypothetical protein